MSKIFVDTNTFLRLLLQDNPEQYKNALKLFTKAANNQIQLISSTVTFFEVKWVLSSFYQINKAALIKHLSQLLSFEPSLFEESKILKEAIDIFQNHSLELEDCYYLAKAKESHCHKFQTFDKKLLKFSQSYL